MRSLGEEAFPTLSKRGDDGMGGSAMVQQRYLPHLNDDLQNVLVVTDNIVERRNCRLVE